jgi:hypothetical protein
MKTAAILVTIVLLIGGAALSAPAAEAGRPFLWTGHNWTQVSEDGKAGYIFGLGNMADFEAAASKGRSAAVAHALGKNLKSMTVLQIVNAVDAFYKANPGKLDTPVIEVLLRGTKSGPPAAAGKEKK